MDKIDVDTSKVLLARYADKETGQFEPAKVRHAFAALKIPIMKSELDAFIENSLIKGKNGISPTDIIEQAERRFKKEQVRKELLVRAFQEYDTEDDGEIDSDLLVYILTEIGSDTTCREDAEEQARSCLNSDTGRCSYVKLVNKWSADELIEEEAKSDDQF
ncbi:hypothetical protein Ciccas_006534 [Cichlidogyrus casuarinus]|uniref:EF-hand domain-containing protein n=1 Tax=Cichlidogyrus casuarinus TaxID=1844966 RepID=A0ABD2Q5I3_9PLAT